MDSIDYFVRDKNFESSKSETLRSGDKQFIIYEQGTVAPPIYRKTSARTISKFQDMADRDPKGFHGTSAFLASPYSVFPEFDAFDPPGKVTDTQFRIDLPILMLYLDKHKPTAKSFINHLAENGTLDVEYKEIIRPFVP